MLRKCSINIKLDNGDFAMPKFNQSYFVTGHDIDLNYRMVPMSALAYFEDCFARYAASKYLAAFDIAGQGLYWVISEIDIRFEGDLSGKGIMAGNRLVITAEDGPILQFEKIDDCSVCKLH